MDIIAYRGSASPPHRRSAGLEASPFVEVQADFERGAESHLLAADVDAELVHHGEGLARLGA